MDFPPFTARDSVPQGPKFPVRATWVVRQAVVVTHGQPRLQGGRTSLPREPRRASPMERDGVVVPVCLFPGSGSCSSPVCQSSLILGPPLLPSRLGPAVAIARFQIQLRSRGPRGQARDPGPLHFIFRSTEVEWGLGPRQPSRVPGAAARHRGLGLLLGARGSGFRS